MKISFGKLTVLFFCVIVVASSVSILTVYAAGGFKSYTVPYTAFSSGTTISSSQMNQNFTYIENALNSLETDIGTKTFHFYKSGWGSKSLTSNTANSVDSQACDPGDRVVGCECESSDREKVWMTDIGINHVSHTCACGFYNSNSASETIEANANCIDF